MFSATAPGSGAHSTRRPSQCPRQPHPCGPCQQCSRPAFRIRHSSGHDAVAEKVVTSLPISAATPPRRSTLTPCSARTSATTRCCNSASSTAAHRISAAGGPPVDELLPSYQKRRRRGAVRRGPNRRRGDDAVAGIVGVTMLVMRPHRARRSPWSGQPNRPRQVRRAITAS